MAESAKRDASSQRLSYEMPSLECFLEKHPLPSEDVTERCVLRGQGGAVRGLWSLLPTGAFSRFWVSQRQFSSGGRWLVLCRLVLGAVLRESGALASQQVMEGGDVWEV